MLVKSLFDKNFCSFLPPADSGEAHVWPTVCHGNGAGAGLPGNILHPPEHSVEGWPSRQHHDLCLPGQPRGDVADHYCYFLFLLFLLPLSFVIALIVIIIMVILTQ